MRIQMRSRWPMCSTPSAKLIEVVELALDDRLEVRLHLAAGDLDDDAERQRSRPRASSISGPTT